MVTQRDSYWCLQLYVYTTRHSYFLCGQCLFVCACGWRLVAVLFCFHRWMEHQAIFFILSPQPDYFARADYWHNTESLDADTG